MNTPLVSIIIPTFNRAHLISETLDSILGQTYENWECIIVDDGSTDNSSKVIRHYLNIDARFQYHTRPKERQKGANACRNIGFEKSKGKFLLFFDSDDVLYSKIVENSVNLFSSNVDFVYFNYSGFSKEITNITYYQNNNSKEPFLDYFSGKINLATPAVLWKRDVINGVIFDESLKKSQELNFVFKIYEKYGLSPLKGMYLDKNGFLVRKHEDSIVSAFHKYKTNYLLSDIKVRNQILNYFNILEFPNIYYYQRNLFEKSIRLYFLHSNLIEFIFFIERFFNNKKPFFLLKFRLIFYKIVFGMTHRKHRLNKAINQLFKEKIYLKISLC